MKSLLLLGSLCLGAAQVNAAGVSAEATRDTGGVSAKPRLVMTADQARAQADKTEAEQLAKARRAAAGTAEREQLILQRQRPEGWQEQQREQAADQFRDSDTRAAKYLREAQRAARQERKIPKP